MPSGVENVPCEESYWRLVRERMLWTFALANRAMSSWTSGELVSICFEASVATRPLSGPADVPPTTLCGR